MSRFQKALRAWHGSPYDFDAFEDKAIGTGEGAQVYGHGHYVAEARPVAEQYRDNLSMIRNSDSINPGEYRSHNGKPVNITNLVAALESGDHQAVSAITGVDSKFPDDSAKFVGKAVLGELHQSHNSQLGGEELLKNTRNFLSQHFPDDLRHLDALESHELGDFVRKLKPLTKSQIRDLKETIPGRLYEVHVALGDDEILDWDTPIKDHHPEAAKKIAEAHADAMNQKPVQKDRYGQPMARRTTDLDTSRAGSVVHGYMARALSSDGWGSNSPAVSKTLLKAGIRGIRYRDQQSRQPSVDLYLDGEKIEPFDRAKEHHLHRAALDDSWGRAASLAGLPSLKSGVIKTVDDLAERVQKSSLGDWLEANKHRVQLKPSRGTYNYVVFDPTDIRVVRKYGKKNELVKDFGTEPVHLTNIEGDHQNG